MTQKWNLQDIRPAEPKRRRSPRKEGPTPNASQSEENTAESRIPVVNGKKKKQTSVIILAITLLFIIVGTILISSLMTGADVTVYPKHRTPTINTSITAYPEQRSGELSYEVMTLTATGEDQVTATGQEEVSEVATGVIEIIKSTPGSERLIANTRFESPDGHIYRILDPVEVPGAVTEADGSVIPGSIRANVTAENPGDTYNQPAGTRFTIPGFAESGLQDLYDSMYAESRGSISGGFDGPRYIIEPDELSAARQALQVELRNSLIEQMDIERPTDYVLFPDAVTFTYEQLPPAEYGDELVTIKEEVTLRVPLFNRHDFAAHIAAATIPAYNDGETVRIDNVADISFRYDTATTTNVNIEQLPSLSFTLVGDPHIIWTFDEEEFKNELANEQKAALRFIIDEFPAIQQADAKITPFWQRSYPSDTELISITEQILPN